MSEQESETLLTKEQMQTLIKDQKQSNKSNNNGKEEGKLKNWVIYCKRRGKKSVYQQYQKQLHEVGRFSNLRAFYGYYYSMKEPSTLETDTKIFYFLKDCRPFWQQWLQSGCLLITIKFKDQQKDQIGARILNNAWEFLLFGLIGNDLPRKKGNSKQLFNNQKQGQQPIIGLILQRREKIAIIQVWYRSQSQANQLTKILDQDLTNHLKLKSQQQKLAIQMRYKRHKDSIQTNSTLKSKNTHNFRLTGTVSLGNF